MPKITSTRGLSPVCAALYIQECANAIKALRYFREDYPELHVIAAGSLLEFALTHSRTHISI